MDFCKSRDDEEHLVAIASTTTLCTEEQDRSHGTVERSIGRFKVNFQLSNVQEAILVRLAPYYENEEFVETVVRPILEQSDGAPSIRSIDWALTNVSKSEQLTCVTKNKEIISMYSAYKNALSHWRRRNFDAFRRKLRVIIQSPHGDLESTVAQINFFWWAHTHGIIDYVRKHLGKIEAHMNMVASETKKYKKTRRPGDRRRSELSTASRNRVFIYENDEPVIFSGSMS